MTTSAERLSGRRIFTIADLDDLEDRRRSSLSTQPSQGLSSRIVTLGQIPQQTNASQLGVNEAIASVREASEAVRQATVNVNGIEKKLSDRLDQIEQNLQKLIAEENKKIADALQNQANSSTITLLQSYTDITEDLARTSLQQRDVQIQTGDNSRCSSYLWITVIVLAILAIIAIALLS